VSIIDARGSRRVLLGALPVASALCSTVARGHAQPSSVTFAAAGDHGLGAATTASPHALAGSGATFYLALGDLSYGSARAERSWCDLGGGQLGQTSQSGGAVMLKKLVVTTPKGRLVLSIGLVLAIGATKFGCAVSQQPIPPASTGSVLHVAAVDDIHGEEASSVSAATATEAAKADFILGLDDYQYADGAMSKYNRYFDKDWGPNAPQVQWEA